MWECSEIGRTRAEAKITLPSGTTYSQPGWCSQTHLWSNLDVLSNPHSDISNADFLCPSVSICSFEICPHFRLRLHTPVEDGAFDQLSSVFTDGGNVIFPSLQSKSEAVSETKSESSFKIDLLPVDQMSSRFCIFMPFRSNTANSTWFSSLRNVITTICYWFAWCILMLILKTLLENG